MKAGTKTLLLWGLLIVMFVAIWQFLAVPSAEPSSPPDPNAWVRLGLGLAVVVSVILTGRRFLAAVNAHNAARAAASAHLEAGRYDEAERVLAPLARSRIAAFRRVFHVHVADIAMRRGSREEALARIEPAIGEPAGLFFRGAQRTASVAARSVRAFLRASVGDEAGARDDIGLVRAAAAATPSARGHAALAEALLLDRAGERTALRELLASSRALVLEAMSRRERALLRAYEAMLDLGNGSVYRRKGRDAADAEGQAIAEWVAVYAPNAAPFVSAGRAASGDPSDATRTEAPSEAARRLLADARDKTVKVGSARGTLVVWVVCILGFLALWGFLQDEPASPALWLPVALIALAVVGLAALGARSIVRRRRDSKRINEAADALGRGDIDGAAKTIDFTPSNPLHRAQADHVRAEIALRRGELGGAISACDAAFTSLAEVQGGKVIAPVAPAGGGVPAWDLARLLAAQRSFALAGLGRGDEAWAEIAWANGLPSTLPIYRVRLFERLAAGDFAGAARVAAARDPSTPLPLRDEALADLVRFVGRPEERSEAEAARLRRELRRDGALAPWLERVAPSIVREFERIVTESPATSELHA